MKQLSEANNNSEIDRLFKAPYIDKKESSEGVSRQENKDQKDISRDVNPPQSRSGVAEDELFPINMEIEHINSGGSSKANHGRKLSEKRPKRPSETGNISVEQLQLGAEGEG